MTNLFCVSQCIAEALDDRLQVDVIYTDFAKAFNRVDHKLLLLKLQAFGLSTSLTRLIASYLSDRKQYVSLNGHVSDSIEVTSGVPQGSILGPLLFTIFINDVVSFVGVNCLLYADDMKLFYNIRSVDDCLALQLSLRSLCQWCSNNGLSLNPMKCRVMSFSLKENIIEFDYRIDDVVVERPASVKDLGIIFDPKLSFASQVQSVSSAAMKTVGFIIRNSRHFTNTTLMKSLFTAFVRPKLEYCCIVWNPGYSTHALLLESVQRRFLKYLAFREDSTYPVRGFPNDILLNRFTFDSLESRRSYFSVVFLWKLMRGDISSPELLMMLGLAVPRQSSRHARVFYLKTARTNVLVHSPLHMAITSYHKVCNDLDIFSCSLSEIRVVLLDYGSG